MKDSQRDFLIDAGLHDAVDHFAVRAVAAKRDDGPRAIRDRFLTHAQTVATRLGELKVHRPESLANPDAQLRPMVADEAVAGHGIRNDQCLGRIKHCRTPRTAFRLFRVELRDA